MIKVENTVVFNLDGAVRGCRNPYDSWGKSDSKWLPDDYGVPADFYIGDKDLALLQKLYKGGTEHRKFMRQIMVSMDITAPLYWYKQFDTYKVGTVSNSCSTMHTLAKKPILPSDFSIDMDVPLPDNVLGDPYFCSGDLAAMIITELERLRQLYAQTKDPAVWRVLIQLLPEGYNQKRTVTFNYEVAATIIRQRAGHKLSEWQDFIAELRCLPYLQQIMGEKLHEESVIPHGE